MMSSEHILREMDYTTYHQSCRDMHITPSFELVECRRAADHDGVHGTRRGSALIAWNNKEE